MGLTEGLITPFDHGDPIFKGNGYTAGLKGAKYTFMHTHCTRVRSSSVITHMHALSYTWLHTSFPRCEIPFFGRPLQRRQHNEVWLTDAHLEKDDKRLSQAFNKGLLTCWGAVGMTVHFRT